MLTAWPTLFIFGASTPLSSYCLLTILLSICLAFQADDVWRPTQIYRLWRLRHWATNAVRCVPGFLLTCSWTGQHGELATATG